MHRHIVMYCPPPTPVRLFPSCVQVAHVVEQATDKENLAQMYWGWAPYL